MLLKKPVLVTDLNASPCLNNSIKNGLNNPSDITPKMADNILKEKYVKTSAG